MTIIGCGGIGSLSAMLLAGSGVAELCLVDGDAVELSNLNRQLFWTPEDVGKFKVDVLAQAITRRHHELVIETVHDNLQQGGLMDFARERHGVLFCADEPLSLLSEVATTACTCPNVVFVSAGYHFATAVTVLHSNEATEPASVGSWTRYRRSIMPSYGPLNAEVAGSAVSVMLAAMPSRRELRRRQERHWSAEAI